MKHFPTESWVDFARGALSQEKATEMARHRENCPECDRASELWRAVAEIGRRENVYSPDSGSVRRAKAAFGLRKIWDAVTQKKTGARLVFDSFLEPLPVGFRNGVAAGRQLHYQAGPLLIDIDLRKGFETREDRVSLAGQVLKVDAPGDRLADFRVFLFRGQRFEGQTRSTPMGEFHFEFPKASNWKLFFEIEGQAAVQISLPNLNPRLPKAGL
jgi:hypothetical protein